MQAARKTKLNLLQQLSELNGAWSGLLEGSWVVISRVISGVTILITHIEGLITLLIPPPDLQVCGFNT